MGMQFNALTPLDTFVGETVDMRTSTADRLIRAAALLPYTAGDGWLDGQCTPRQALDGLAKWTDGHPDPLICRRMGELANLCHAALRAGPNVVITWG